jgi:hypothetical protein
MAEHTLDGSKHACLIINDQDSRRAQAVLSAVLSSTTGNRTLITVPASGWLSIFISPRTFQIIERQIDNPSPLPLCLVVKNGS